MEAAEQVRGVEPDPGVKSLMSALAGDDHATAAAAVFMQVRVRMARAAALPRA